MCRRHTAIRPAVLFWCAVAIVLAVYTDASWGVTSYIASGAMCSHSITLLRVICGLARMDTLLCGTICWVTPLATLIIIMKAQCQ